MTEIGAIQRVLGVCLAGIFACIGCSNTPEARLLRAAERGDEAEVRQLLDSGVSTQAKDGWSGTPLMYAAANCRVPIVRLLVARGADVNERARLGRSPLMWAAQAGCEDVTRFLLETGARSDLRDSQGATAAELAKENGHFDLAAKVGGTP